MTETKLFCDGTMFSFLNFNKTLTTVCLSDIVDIFDDDDSCIVVCSDDIYHCKVLTEIVIDFLNSYNFSF